MEWIGIETGCGGRVQDAGCGRRRFIAGGANSAIMPGAGAALAQLVEHSIRNAGVVGSSPTGGTISRKA